jgi:hypothetical protein
MRVDGFLTSHKAASRLLVWVLLLNAFVLCSAIPTLSANVKRDDAPSLLNNLVSQFKKAIPVASQTGTNLLNQLLSSLQGGSYTIPQHSTSSIIRAANLALVRGAFLYGSPLAGGPAYPSGLLGIAKDVQDVANIQIDLTPELANAAVDLAKATLDAPKVRKCGTTSMPKNANT